MDFIRETIMYFHKGGLVMWPLLFCSFTVFAIAIARFSFYNVSDTCKLFKTDDCNLLFQIKLQ